MIDSNIVPNFQPLLQMAIQLQRAKKIAEAKKIYEFILNQDSKNFDALHMLGEIAYSTSDLQTALDYFNKALKVDDQFYLIHYNRGLILKKMHLLEEAVASYNAAIKLNKTHVQSYSNRGNILSSLKKYDLAISDFNQAIAIDSNYAQV